MKNIKIYIALLFSLLLILTPAYALADGSNDVTAYLSVSDTTVTSGTTVTCTITVTNTDNTYGADIAISRGGQNIDSYYLGAGQTRNTVHNITVHKTSDITYKVYASHGPDISTNKNTNTVTVHVQQPATPTPDTSTPPPTQTPNVSAETATPTPTAVITEAVTPQVTPYIAPDENLGWGKPIKIESSSVRIMDDVFQENFGDWLGVGSEASGDYQYIYIIRRIISAIAGFVVLSFITLIIAAIRILK